MRILILICFIMGTIISVKAQNLDCSEFKTGSFSMYDSTSKMTITIERTAKKQTESTPSGDKVKLNVTWTDDCTYVLSMKGSSPLEVHINKIVGNTYWFTAYPEGSTVGISGAITKKD